MLPLVYKNMGFFQNKMYAFVRHKHRLKFIEFKLSMYYVRPKLLKDKNPVFNEQS